MKRLREKWNSSQGASILIALLLLLVCMMVASSVLMAAASNAGKLRSSREEHQKYLTLSSALRLVCGEIQGSSYVGEYSYDKETVTVENEVKDKDGNPVLNAEGKPAIEIIKLYDVHTYTQTEGEFTCGLNTGPTSEVLPLREQLDFLFGKKLAAGAGVARNPNDVYVFNPLNLHFNFPVSYTLTVKPENENDVFKPVSIDFSLREDGIITLTASLPEDSNGYVYAMEAELEPVEPLNDVFVLKDAGDFQTEPVQWKLNWIAKKGA